MLITCILNLFFYLKVIMYEIEKYILNHEAMKLLLLIVSPRLGSL